MCISPIIKKVTRTGVYCSRTLPFGYRLARAENMKYDVKTDKFGKTTKSNVYVRDSCLLVDDTKGYDFYVELDCGKCGECIRKCLNRWSWRLEKAMNGKRAYFLTLTYDRAHLHTYKKLVDEDGTTIRLYDGHGLLVYSDLQEYHKLLRRELEYWYGITNVKFFSCGEYGSESKTLRNGIVTDGFRPHFHELCWFDATQKCLGYDRFISKRGRPSTFFNTVAGKIFKVPVLSHTVFKNLCLKCWKRCSVFGFHCSYVRNVKACSRYICKYILKQKINEINYGSYAQQHFPYLRRMSQGISKDYIMSIARDIVENREFGIESKDSAGKEFFFFLPPVCLKWAYSICNSLLEEDEDLTLDKGKIKRRPFVISVEYLEMTRKRDKYIAEHPKDDEEELRKYDKLVKQQYLASQSLIFDF